MLGLPWKEQQPFVTQTSPSAQSVLRSQPASSSHDGLRLTQVTCPSVVTSQVPQLSPPAHVGPLQEAPLQPPGGDGLAQLVTAQPPWRHVSWARHVMVQLPQVRTSLVRSTHPPPHSAVPPGQAHRPS
jgi:hypothetical protein